jgi:serine/threonine protein kinase/Tfp pilus assembly protein PilF
MNRKHIRRIEEIFDRVSQVAVDERGPLLDEACGQDTELRAELENLLGVFEKAVDYFGDFMASVGAGAELDAAAGRSRIIGRWRLVDLIGRGGTAAVYLAERADGEFEQTAAFKVLRFGLDSGSAAERFATERQILARVQHPHIAGLIDGGISPDGLPYLVMEYVDGVPITEYCNRNSLTIRQRLALFRDVAEAVQYAHQNLVVHRDLKPGNILVTADGWIKLLDFGIAKLIDQEQAANATVTAQRMLTPVYAAPEQVVGGPITTATDVYALGVLLYELLAGQRPYEVQGLTAAESERLIVHVTPPAPSTVVSEENCPKCGLRPARLRRLLAGDLDNICMMSLRKEPKLRYASADQLGEEIDRYLKGMPVQARRASANYRLRKFVGRHRLGVTLSAAAVLLLIGFAASMAVVSTQLARERELSDRVTRLFVDVFAVADPSQGATITAREVLDRGARRIKADLEGQPEVQTELLDVMGRVYSNLGLYDNAVGLLESSVQLRERTEGESDHLADSLEALGEAQRLRGDYPAAEGTMRKAMRLSLALGGEIHPRTARSMTGLGRVLLARGNYDEAEMTLRRSLAALRAGPLRQPEVMADALDTLAGLDLARGRVVESQRMFEQSLNIRRSLFHPDSAKVAASLNNLATALGHGGKHARAEDLQRQALKIYTEIFGEEHPNVATARNNLGLTLFAERKLEEAEALFRQSLASRRRLLPSGHADIAQSASNLGLLLQTSGRYDEAARLYQNALKIRRAAFGDKHLRVAQTLNNLGMLEQIRGNYPAAEASLREAFETFRELFGNDHRLVATNLSNLASVLYSEGKLEEAEADYRESLRIRRAVLPANHLDTSYSLVGLARLLCASPSPERRSQAETMAREALKIRQARLPEADPLISEAEQVLAAAQRPDEDPTNQAPVGR